MSFTEIHITVTHDSVDSISEELSLLGAASVTFLDGGDDPIFEPSQTTPILWENTIVIGLFEKNINIDLIIESLKNNNNFNIIELVLKNVPNEDWIKKTLDNFKPIKFGERLWVCPSWQKIPNPQDINIILDPGQAFGTGTHPTTALCLEWLEKNIKNPIKITDYGSGSGILGIAALKLGAKHVNCVDIDPKALEVTAQNMYHNGIQDTEFNTFLPENAPLEARDLVIANILSEPLINLSQKLKKLTKPLGKIILSGILRDQVDSVRTAYKQNFLLQPIVYKEEWCLLVGIRANNI